MTFTLITAGGTIDKVYGTGLGVHDLHVGEPVAPEILRKMFGVFRFSHREALRKDSLEMTEADRRLICEMAFWDHDEEQRILITHGTDTMIETAKALAQDKALSEKRIVFIGASQPACMRDSDAPARIGFGLGVLLTSRKPGVIIAMDGIHTDPDYCQKNEDGIFRSYS
ncbi:MAG: asparaginase [Candidatus Moranbacteria bacterium]|nr:asparaginase [Candidatus Moranbacteria bacterium]